MDSQMAQIIARNFIARYPKPEKKYGQYLHDSVVMTDLERNALHVLAHCIEISAYPEQTKMMEILKKEMKEVKQKVADESVGGAGVGTGQIEEGIVDGRGW